MILWHLENMLTLAVRMYCNECCIAIIWYSHLWICSRSDSVQTGLRNSENLSWKGAWKVLKLVTHKRGGTPCGALLHSLHMASNTPGRLASDRKVC